jgi:glutaredoxin
VPKIILFTSTNCPNCHTLKAKLEAEGVAFTERNVDVDPEANIDLLMTGRCTVPTLVIDGIVQEDIAPSTSVFSFGDKAKK